MHDPHRFFIYLSYRRQNVLGKLQLHHLIPPSWKPSKSKFEPTRQHSVPPSRKNIQQKLTFQRLS